MKLFTYSKTTFESKLCSNKRIDKITNREVLNISFITRTCTYFNNFNALKSIHFAFVGSQLKYSCLDWYSNNLGVT